MNVKPALLCISTLVYFACATGNPKQDIEFELSRLQDSLMNLHDMTMTGHSECLSLIDELKTFSDSAPDSDKIHIDSVRTELDYASEIMMDWMDGFEDPVAKDTSAIFYLKEQIKIIHDIAMHQRNSISAARSILQSGSSK